jgi:hypothetical protein
LRGRGRRCALLLRGVAPGCADIEGKRTAKARGREGNAKKTGGGLPDWQVGSFCSSDWDGARWRGLAGFGARWHKWHAYPRRGRGMASDAHGGEGRHGTRNGGRALCAHGASV